MSAADDTCSQCPHPFGGHLMLNTTGDVMQGGLILCQEDGCTCLATWGTGGPPRASAEEQLRELFEPSADFDVPAAIAALRERVMARSRRGAGTEQGEGEGEGA